MAATLPLNGVIRGRNSSSAPTSFYLAVAIFGLLMLRTLWIAAGGEERILVNVPDDAFYYFVLAKQHAATGQWTFDGVAPATGFHLLWAYILSTLYRLNDWPLDSLFLLCGLIGSACLAVSAWAMSRVMVEQYNWTGIWGVLFVLIGQSYFLLPTMAMEAPLVIMFSTLLVYVASNNRGILLAFAIGFLGELARSDFGLVPVSLLIAALLTSQTCANRQCAFAGCCGAVVGLAISIGHSYAISGQFIQNSALMKEYWSGLAGHSIVPPLLLLGDVFSLGVGPVGVTLFLVLGAAAGMHARNSGKGSLLWIASLLITFGYLALYRYNSQEIQPWYLASFVIPCTTFCSGAIALLARTISKSVLIASVSVLIFLNLAASIRPIWPHMLLMAKAGKILHDKQMVVGAWNAGIIGYMNFGRTVNLDGLVNDDIVPHAKNGTLFEYIRERKIGTIADFGVMLSEQYRARGGYADGKLAACMRVTQTIELPGIRPWRGESFRIYQVHCG